jgi:hypothetical protein
MSTRELGYIAQTCVVCVSLSHFFPTDLCEVVFARVIYSSRSGSYNESRGPTGGLRTGQTLCCRTQRLGVANDVFNGVGMPDLVVCHTTLGQWYGVVPLHH